MSGVGGYATHRVDLGQVEQLVAAMASFDARVEARAGDLDARVQRLHGVWEGQAAQAQKEAHAELVAGLARMREGLQRLREAGRVAHGNYGAAVAANRAMFGQVG